MIFSTIASELDLDSAAELKLEIPDLKMGQTQSIHRGNTATQVFQAKGLIDVDYLVAQLQAVAQNPVVLAHSNEGQLHDVQRYSRQAAEKLEKPFERLRRLAYAVRFEGRQSIPLHKANIKVRIISLSLWSYLASGRSTASLTS